MCLLIWKKAGLKISRQSLENGDINNPDGAGFAYIKNNQIIVDKGWMVFDQFYKEYKKHEEQDLMIHFRAASPGMDVTPEMNHPFFVETSDGDLWRLKDKTARFQYAIAHNGRLPYTGTAKESDTFLFVKEIIAPLLQQNPFHFDQPGNRWLMEKAIGDTNKMCILMLDRSNKKCFYYILNEKGGAWDKKAHWKDEIWWSNDSYLPAKKVVNIQQSIGGYYGDGWDADSRAASNYQYQGNVGQQTKAYTSTEGQKFDEPDGLYANEFNTPDAHGWYWSYRIHKWKNKNTGAEAAVLSSRLERPLYIQIQERRQVYYDMKKKEAMDKKAAQDATFNAALALAEKNIDAAKKATDFSNQMVADFHALSSDEFKKKYPNASINPDIQVPRDEGVLDEEDPKDETTGGKVKLPHFSKKERRTFVAHCREWFRDDMGNDKDLNDSHIILWARNQYKNTFKFPEDASVEQIDRCMLNDLEASIK